VHLTLKNSTLVLADAWALSQYTVLSTQLSKLTAQRLAFDNVKFDATIYLDSYGCYLLQSLINYCHDHNVNITVPSKIDQQLKNYNFDQSSNFNVQKTQDNIVANLGRSVSHIPQSFKNGLTFLGQFIDQLSQCLKRQEKFRSKTLGNILEQAGINALGIIGLVAFLLGIVLVYQGANQLLRFGAQIFTINLLAISVLRELGILMTAIIIAGRSGSAFTAELGFMKLNNEIDALNVMGINPFNLLVIPRVVGLMIALPLLAVFADLIALLGGGLLSTIIIDVSWGQYWQQLKLAVTPWTVWSGLIKAPFFGFVIGAISCYEGFSVSGGSEDVGRRTTASVVRSIFIVIVIDALFSVIYAKLGL